MSIEKMLLGFISADEAGAFVLQGRWGVGKTYFWKQRIIAQLLKDPKIPRHRKKYSYVSMFGIQSLEDLKAGIFQAGNEFDSEFLTSKWRFISPRWLWWNLKKALPFAVESGAIPYVNIGLARSYNALTFFTIRDRLICLDDIERRGSELRLLDVLGLVSQLADQRHCRVVVILNSDALQVSDDDIWRKQKEKVFLGEMTFSPTPEQCIDLGLSDVQGESWVRLARECLLVLGVSNIRIVHRARRSIRKVLSSVTDRPLMAETVDRVVRVLVMLEFAHNGKGEGAPPMDFVLGSGPWDYTVMEMSNEERTEEERIWAKLVSDYNVYFGDELDLALASMVRAGFPDEDELNRTIRDYEARAQRNANKAAWESSWRLYHDTLEDNTDELLDAFERTWPPVSEAMSANNVQSLVELVRSLGRPGVASRFIEEWVQQRSGDRIDELGPDQFHAFGPITDPELVAAMESAFVGDPRLPDLTNAIRAMAEDGGTSLDAVKAIAAAEIPEIIETLVGNSGRYLSAAISNTLRLGDHPREPSWTRARDNMRSAMLELSTRSPLLANRVRNKFGTLLGMD